MKALKRNVVVLLVVVAFVGFVWGVFAWTRHSMEQSNEKERTRPMTVEERAEAIKQVSRGFAHEYTDADFEGVSDIDLRAFLRTGCETGYMGSFEWPCGDVRSEQSAGYIVGNRMFFADPSVYAKKVWTADFVFLPVSKTYLIKQHYQVLYRSPEAVSDSLGISLADAQIIWDRTRK